jgi:hypothetical protein
VNCGSSEPKTLKNGLWTSDGKCHSVHEENVWLCASCLLFFPRPIFHNCRKFFLNKGVRRIRSTEDELSSSVFTVVFCSSQESVLNTGSFYTIYGNPTSIQVHIKNE